MRPQLSGLPMMEGRLNDAKDINSRFYFDTGAELCLLFTSEFTADSAVSALRRNSRCVPRVRGWAGKKRCS